MDEEIVLVKCAQAGGTMTLAFSSGEILELAADSVPDQLPAVGERIPASLVIRLREGAERKQIAGRLFKLLDRRLYSVAALRVKLTKDGFARTSVDTVLESFAAQGLHSDRQFAAAYCRDTLRRRPVGRRYLWAKLRDQSVQAEAIESVLQDLMPAEREADLALLAARSRWARESEVGDPRSEARVMRFLMSRGFGASLARRAARTATPDPGDIA